MENRKLLYLKPPHTSPVLLSDIRAAGWDAEVAEHFDDASSMLASQRFHVGLALFNSPDREDLPGENLISSGGPIEWIALLPPAYMQNEEISQMIRENFYDYHTLPADSERLLPILGHAYGMASIRHKSSPRQEEEYPGEDEMVGASPVMLTLFANLRKIAGVEAPVLITGESGTGKELGARAIHERSSRAGGPFVAVNCGALPPSLIQSELFGYEKGAFTGAGQRKIGRIEAAAGGTIFLDEIGDLPLDMQVNLLRFLQEKTIERVGGTEHISVDARVIAATHVDLEAAVKEGRFREDLYYRLHVLDLKMPALRERRGDVELLARFFFKKFAAEKRQNVQGFTQEALRLMNDHDWPGNVREMINRIRRAMIMCENRLITPADLGLERRVLGRRMRTLDEVRETAEREAIQTALRRTHKNVSRAAQELGVSRVTLYRLMEKCGLHQTHGMM
jgi:DNA-binding NtrC family response regulator